MLSYYCLKCRKNTESKNPKVARTKNGRNSKKIKETIGLLSSLGIKKHLSKIPLTCPPLFQ